jgi:hypothetical protein
MVINIVQAIILNDVASPVLLASGCKKYICDAVIYF